MSDLLLFQQRFAAALGGGPGPNAEGMAVYRNGWVRASVDALAAAYPAVRAILGERAFEQAALGYVLSHPPASPVLARYGRAFAGFLADQSWAGELPYLADVARLERMRAEAHVAADADPLDPASLRGLAAEDWLSLRLPLHPACRFALFPTPAFSIWQAQVGEAPAAFDPGRRAEAVLVVRPRDAVEASLLEPSEHRMLASMAAGRTVGEAALDLAAAFPEADLSALFARLISGGALLPPVKG